jgi:hypothetical protein
LSAPRPSHTKRQKERARQERQKQKSERRAQRQSDRKERPAGATGEDPDLAGIVPGPQARWWEEEAVAVDEEAPGEREA